MKKSELKKYAKLIVQVGANVKKKQEVIVNAPIAASELVEYVVEEAYKKGAKRVTVNWSNSKISKMDYNYQTVETLSETFEYEHAKQLHYTNVLPVMINIVSPNPDAFVGVDATKVAQSSKVRGMEFKKYRDMIDGKYQWTIVAYPNEEWAKKVFPDLNAKKGMKELWNAISKCSRLEGNAISNWKNHNENLLSKKTILDNLKIKELHFKSDNGTDFKVGLLEKTHFIAGGLTCGKVYYNPNLPTEECFISPSKHSANGVVYSTKPLSVRGSLVDEFGFRFENGKVVEVLTKNDEHKTILENLINSDEGARMLGEVALVPFSSPVNETNILFYNTLFDENACCHLALGRAFSFVIDNNEKMSKEEIDAFDLNDSIIHVDFMIGSKDMNITATTFDGKSVQIFKDGEWSI